jgi:AcrR family transcriptional regulator
MKNTKARILGTSLALFNELGLAKVTLRTIAKQMGISQGNLNYHFKKREDILVGLYHELVHKMEENMAASQNIEVSLKNTFEQLTGVMQHFYDYRFFMLDFVQIMRENKTINSHYTQLSKLRTLQFNAMFQLLVKEKIMRTEELKEEYANLYIRLTILGEFWLSSAITTQTLSPTLVKEYSLIIFQSIYPYLTPKGKKQFQVLA